jgi:hypothetical protein
VIKMSIDLKALNRPMLIRALEKEGWTVQERRGVLYARDKDYNSVEIHPDRAVVNKGNEDLIPKIYGAYNRELVRTQVKQFGGKLESVPGQANKWKITLPQFSKSSFTQKSQF